MSKRIKLMIIVLVIAGGSTARAQFVEAPQYLTQSPAGRGPLSVAVGNFEGDSSGHDDVAVIDAAGTVSVFLNRRDGTGSFSEPATYKINTNAASYTIASGDFQSATQAAQDLVVADSGGNVTVLLNNDQGDGGFRNPQSVLSTSAKFTSLVTSDLHDKNNEGLSDIAVVDASSGSVIVLASQGGGTFAQPVSYSSNLVAGQAMFLSVGNLVTPRPAHNDLAVAAVDGSLSVLVNKTKSGSITFAAGVVVSPSASHGGIPSGVTSIVGVEEATVSQGGSGVDDLVIASTGTGTVQGFASPLPSVWYVLNLTPSQGSLSFFLYQNYDQPTSQVGFNPVSLSSTDIDGDGNADLLIGNSTDNSASVLFGDGVGDLSSIPVTGGPPLIPLEFGTRLGAVALTTGRFSGGSSQVVPDVAVADQTGNSLTILLNNELDQNSNWLEFRGARSDWLTPAFPIAVGAGLVQTSQTENGLPDALVANQSNLSPETGNGPFSDFASDGTGNFASANTYGGGYGIATPDGLVSADFNGDGYVDVALVDSKGLVSVFLDDVSQGISTGYDIAPSQVSVGTSATQYSLALGNFTSGQTQPDLVVADSSGYVTIVLNDGKGNIKLGDRVQASATFTSVAVADLNGDGIPDVVAGDSSTGLVWVFEGKPGGQLAPGFSVTTNLSAGEVFLALGKFSSASRQVPDVAVASQSGQVEVLVNLSSGSAIRFSQPVTVYNFPGGATSLAAWDFNQDGLADLVVGSMQAWLFFNTTPYGATPAFTVPFGYAAGNSPVAFAVADFNGDGTPDLAIANSTSTTHNPPTSSNTLSILMNTGFFAKVTLASSANPVQVGHPVTFTATVRGSKSAPTGQITFYDGPTKLGSSTITSGVATLSTSSLAVGTHYITAIYSGDSNYGPSVSLPLQEEVTQNAPQNTTTFLASSVNPSQLGESVSFTATVKPVSGQGTPVGTVQFLDGTTLLSTVNLNGGAAVYSTSALALGKHSMTAVYSGGQNFEQSTSSPLVQQVVPPPPPTPDFSLTASPATTTLSPGNSASFTIKGLQINGFSGSIALTCNSGLPVGVSCQFFPSTVAIGAGGSSSTSTLTLNTQGSSSMGTLRPAKHSGPTFLYATGLLGAPVLLGVLILSGPHGRRRFQSCLLLLMLGLGIALQPACGGGTSGSPGDPPSGTPAGSYQVTVAGSSGSKRHAAIVTLIVQ